MRARTRPHTRGMWDQSVLQIAWHECTLARGRRRSPNVAQISGQIQRARANFLPTFGLDVAGVQDRTTLIIA